nr:hypothetical protein [Micromonospora craniellae]
MGEHEERCVGPSQQVVTHDTRGRAVDEVPTVDVFVLGEVQVEEGFSVVGGDGARSGAKVEDAHRDEACFIPFTSQ